MADLPCQITIKGFRSSEWKLVYEYKGVLSHFKTFQCVYPNYGPLQITMTHDFRRGRKARILYRVQERTTDSPFQAVRYYNEEVKVKLNGGRRKPPGSPETIGRRKGTVYRHGDERA